MKRIFTLIALVFATGMVTAQITRPDLPMIGDSQYFTAADTTGINPGAGGTGQTWDFSGAQANGSNLTITWVDPNNHTQGGNFPSANIAYTTSLDDYRFYTLDSDSMVLVGEKSLTGTPAPYTTQCTQLRFPVNLNDSSTDSLEGEYFDGFLTQVTRWGEVTTMYDGTGTLITPYATYNNVSRIFTSANYRDSSWTGAATSDIFIYRYEWYESGMRIPAFVYNIQLVSVNGGAFTEQIDIWYADTNLVSVDAQLLSNSFGVYPNPADDLAKVSYQLSGAAHVTLELYNGLGERVRVIRDGEQPAGAFTHTLETGGLGSGIYFLRLKAGDQLETRKLVLQ